MPFVGAIPSSVILLVVMLCAEGQPPPQGLTDLLYKNVSGGFAGLVSATGSAGEVCYQKSVIEDGSTIFCPSGEAAAAWVTKTAVDKSPLAVHHAVSLLNVSCAAWSPPPGQAPSEKRHAAPPKPADVDTRALTPGTSPADEKAARCTARCWWPVPAAAAIGIGILLSPLQAQELDIQGTSDKSIDRLISENQNSTVDPARPSWSSAAPVDNGGGGEFYCAICMETASSILKFRVSSCSHSFCLSCIVQYVAAKLDENVVHVECPDPGCGDGAVEPESCHGIIPSFLLDKWGLLLCESALCAKRFYCPYRDCSAPLFAGDEATRQAECPYCHRLLCARCVVPWHDGVGCKEFQELREDEPGREDIMLRRLAGRRKWQQCPKCHMYVEKSEGCNYIKCRCGYGFCYVCASKVSKITHYCNKCQR